MKNDDITRYTGKNDDVILSPTVGAFKSGYPLLIGSIKYALKTVQEQGIKLPWPENKLFYLLYTTAIAEGAALPLSALHFPRNGWTQASGPFQFLLSTQKGIEKEYSWLPKDAFDNPFFHATYALLLLLNIIKRNGHERLNNISNFAGVSDPLMKQFIGIRMAYIGGSVKGDSILVEAYKGSVHYIPILYEYLYNDVSTAKTFRKYYVPFFLDSLKNVDRLSKKYIQDAVIGMGDAPINAYQPQCKWWTVSKTHLDLLEPLPDWMKLVLQYVDAATDPLKWDIVITSINVSPDKGEPRGGTHVSHNAFDIIHFRKDAINAAMAKYPEKGKMPIFKHYPIEGVMSYDALEECLLTSPFPHYSRDPSVYLVVKMLRSYLFTKDGQDITFCCEPDHLHIDNSPHLSLGRNKNPFIIIMDYPKLMKYLPMEVYYSLHVNQGKNVFLI